MIFNVRFEFLTFIFLVARIQEFSAVGVLINNCIVYFFPSYWWYLLSAKTRLFLKDAHLETQFKILLV